MTSTEPVSIRFSPPSPWLLGFPGWKIAQTEESEHYQLLRTLEIRAFSSTQTWAEVELADGSNGSKKGWVYWGKSLDDDRNFVISENERNTHDSEASSPSTQP